MPSYIFVCPKCGKEREVWTNTIRDVKPTSNCPCGSPASAYLPTITCTNFILKGPRWSKDGYSK
jgi:putative FmdB family regulatory protein